MLNKIIISVHVPGFKLDECRATIDKDGVIIKFPTAYPHMKTIITKTVAQAEEVGFNTNLMRERWDGKMIYVMEEHTFEDGMILVDSGLVTISHKEKGYTRTFTSGKPNISSLSKSELPEFDSVHDVLAAYPDSKLAFGVGDFLDGKVVIDWHKDTPIGTKVLTDGVVDALNEIRLDGEPFRVITDTGGYRFIISSESMDATFFYPPINKFDYHFYPDKESDIFIGMEKVPGQLNMMQIAIANYLDLEGLLLDVIR